jgi:hypothetical protein
MFCRLLCNRPHQLALPALSQLDQTRNLFYLLCSSMHISVLISGMLLAPRLSAARRKSRWAAVASPLRQSRTPSPVACWQVLLPLCASPRVAVLSYSVLVVYRLISMSGLRHDPLHACCRRRGTQMRCGGPGGAWRSSAAAGTRSACGSCPACSSSSSLARCRMPRSRPFFCLIHSAARMQHATPHHEVAHASSHGVGQCYTFAVCLDIAQELREVLGEVATASVATGVLGVGGNKGAVAIGFTLHRRRVAFLASHFAAHQVRSAPGSALPVRPGRCTGVTGSRAVPGRNTTHLELCPSSTLQPGKKWSFWTALIVREQAVVFAAILRCNKQTPWHCAVSNGAVSCSGPQDANSICWAAGDERLRMSCCRAHTLPARAADVCSPAVCTTAQCARWGGHPLK